MRSGLTRLLFIVVAGLFLLGLWKGYYHGGQDFRVFEAAARFAREEKWDALYHEGPDRFLYAPGFAIIFAPFTILPTPIFHAIWLGFTALSFFLVMKYFAKKVGAVPVLFATLFSMRAIWIDLRYGQTNLLIFSAALFALLVWVDSCSRLRTLGISWFLLGVGIVTKLYPFALLAFPAVRLARSFFSNSSDRRPWLRDFTAVACAVLGGLTLLLLPFIFAPGFGGFLCGEWMDALARKGFPTDTHNQSFLAFLYRAFSGEPFQSLGLGATPLRSPFQFLGTTEIKLIWGVATLGMGGLFLLESWRASNAQNKIKNVAYGMALCFLPAHLIWKSYFIFGMPLVAVLAARGKWLPLIILGCVLSFSSNSILGAVPAAWCEALSLFLWVHVTVIGWATFSKEKRDSEAEKAEPIWT
ncbi:MAG: DUF2029 domain-containing protein [Cryobacterium sp.]|nr:DUF2029 domain-containing protein [Oligoflexia bacterium]